MKVLALISQLCLAPNSSSTVQWVMYEQHKCQKYYVNCIGSQMALMPEHKAEKKLMQCVALKGYGLAKK